MCRVDTRSIETTIQRLISSGLDPRLENNPYLLFVFTSFQVCLWLQLLPLKATDALPCLACLMLDVLADHRSGSWTSSQIMN